MIGALAVVGTTLVVLALILWDVIRRALRSQEIRAKLRLAEEEQKTAAQLRKDLDEKWFEHRLGVEQELAVFRLEVGGLKKTVESVIAGTDYRRVLGERRSRG